MRNRVYLFGTGSFKSITSGQVFSSARAKREEKEFIKSLTQIVKYSEEDRKREILKILNAEENCKDLLKKMLKQKNRI